MSNDIQSKQNTLIQSTEGIGDILVFETKRYKNKLILDGLKKIKDLIIKLLDIKHKNPEHFNKLVFSQDFIELYNTDEDNAKAALFFKPKENAIGFSTLIYQIIRVYKTAIKSQNQEVSYTASKYIISVLSEFVKSANNDIFANIILKIIVELTEISISHDDNSIYSFIYSYKNIVFNPLDDEQIKFDLSYIELFDKYLFWTFKYIIKNNNNLLFKKLISLFLYDEIYIPISNKSHLQDYTHILLNSNFQKYAELRVEIENQKRKLEDLMDNIDSKSKLQNWIREFDKLKNSIINNLTINQIEEARKLEQKIKRLVNLNFKYNNLKKIIFGVCAYCLFKKRFSYIKYIWEYKQPRGSVTSWIGPDLIPRTFNEIVDFYFGKSLAENNIDFWEDHHDSEIYYKRYFLLLLALALKHKDSTLEDTSFSVRPKLLFKEFDINKLNDFNNSIDEYIALSNNLKNERKPFKKLGFEINNLNELFESKLIPSLKCLKENAAKEISRRHRTGRISANKIKNFKDEFINNFYYYATIRNIFINYLKLYIDKINEKVSHAISLFGVDDFPDKAIFFDERYSNYTGIQSWGSNFAHCENSYLIDNISKDCKNIKHSEFETSIMKYENIADTIIITTEKAFYQYLEGLKQFNPKHHRSIQSLNINGFEGWYKLEGKLIPVFKASHKKNEQVLILNKNYLGQLVQYSPLNEKENKSSIVDIFYIKIQALSEDIALIEQLMKNELQRPKNTDNFQESMEEKVLVRIYERFEYLQSSNFKGYKLLIE